MRDYMRTRCTRSRIGGSSNYDTGMSARIACVLVIAGCLAKPARPGANCGDGTLDNDEVCDDGGLEDGDGCSATCEIEPWYECPTVGVPCLPVLALRWTMPGTTLPDLGGSGGGTDFDDDCAALIGVSGTNTVIVGFEGNTATDGVAISRLGALCADIRLGPDGHIQWTNPKTTTLQGNDDGITHDVQTCDADEVAAGFVGNAGNFVSGFDLICQPISHVDGALSFGTPHRLTTLGPANQMMKPLESCGSDQAVRAVVGKSGAVIDQMTMRCVPTTEVVCGDGVITDPETCDDGNAIPGDGCNATCNGN